MTDGALCVAGLGASTCVGRDAIATAAAVRAGISGFVDHPYMVSQAGESFQVAKAPWVDPDREGVERLTALLFPALDEALTPLGHVQSHRLRVALSLGLPASRPGLPADLQPTLIGAISSRYRGRFDGVAAFPIGHAAGMRALEAAVIQMLHGRFDACIVAGADSYIDPDTLEWLEANDQLHGAGPRKYPWGFIPGEAAGAMLLVSGALAQQAQLFVIACLLGTGMAVEPKAIKTETVCIGEGLTAALRAALRTLPTGARITDLYCDLNGEPYRADEYGFATLRVSEQYDPDLDCVTPTDCLGDIGAASAPVLSLLACIGSWKGYSRGQLALVFCGSEGGERGAAVLATSAPGGSAGA
jgi:3-oxoacyl-[acyl-carrier-protein] synthase I